ncbi:conserved hypothetical protein [Ricinus communis]|uniref:Uncharacterized protein n=1 Tax=Ricinus communis TaxID=3988 RepID=B9SL60_RICCO|nr:conserved hypothetical protein [Ricinus communis]
MQMGPDCNFNHNLLSEMRAVVAVDVVFYVGKGSGIDGKDGAANGAGGLVS